MLDSSSMGVQSIANSRGQSKFAFERPNNLRQLSTGANITQGNSPSGALWLFSKSRQELKDSTLRLLEELSQTLGLEPSLDYLCTNGEVEIALHHYLNTPAVSEENPEHRDWSLLTLLLHENTGISNGLEVAELPGRNRGKQAAVRHAKFIPVNPANGEITVDPELFKPGDPITLGQILILLVQGGVHHIRFPQGRFVAVEHPMPSRTLRMDAALSKPEKTIQGMTRPLLRFGEAMQLADQRNEMRQKAASYRIVLDFKNFDQPLQSILAPSKSSLPTLHLGGQKSTCIDSDFPIVLELSFVGESSCRILSAQSRSGVSSIILSCASERCQASLRQYVRVSMGSSTGSVLLHRTPYNLRDSSRFLICARPRR
ncbi:hypothetical protein CBS147321_10556 [Aspergillus niger]|nr:hypothetical protein CBS147321_10556 [Aspergillus niger]